MLDVLGGQVVANAACQPRSEPVGPRCLPALHRGERGQRKIESYNVLHPGRAGGHGDTDEHGENQEAAAQRCGADRGGGAELEGRSRRRHAMRREGCPIPVQE